MNKSETEKFFTKVMESISENCSDESFEKWLEMNFSDILGAGTVRELYEMDIPIEKLERLIVNIEPLLRRVECCHEMDRMIPHDVKMCSHAQKRCFLF